MKKRKITKIDFIYTPIEGEELEKILYPHKFRKNKKNGKKSKASRNKKSV